MQPLAIARVTGLLLIVFSNFMLPPALLGWLAQDGTLKPFLQAYFITLVAGAVLWIATQDANRELRLRDGFVIVTLFWGLLAAFGALPLRLSGVTPRFVDAYFEAMSGLSTTGASVLSGLDRLPDSINLWRGLMQLLGGMGIVVLAVAILPLLGVGGLQLYKAETPGPMKESKLTPRIKETAKALWTIYLGLVLACFLALWAAGMTPFDALIHSFAALSTGGFSNYDASVGHFQSPLIEAILACFVFLGGVNFALHFLALRHRDWRYYWRDGEFRAYGGTLLAAAVFVTVYLYESRTYTDFLDALRYGAFQVISMATTTGYVSADFGAWPPVLGALLMVLPFFCSSAGSTGGGMKMIRVLMLFKQGVSEFRRLLHPAAVVPVKLCGRVVPERTLAAVTTFFVAYLGIYATLGLLVAAMGVDLVTAFSAVASCLTNTGPGLGEVGPASNYAGLPAAAKLLLAFAMLAGRLELFTLLVLLTPSFWRS